MECPKSLITSQSSTWVEQHAAQRRLGIPSSEQIAARTAEAFLILDQELSMEITDND